MPRPFEDYDKIRFDLTSKLESIELTILRLQFDDYGDHHDIKKELIEGRLNAYRARLDKINFLIDQVLQHPQFTYQIDEILTDFIRELIKFERAIENYSNNELRLNAPSPFEGYKVYKDNGVVYPAIKERNDAYDARIEAVKSNHNPRLLVKLLNEKEFMNYESRQKLMEATYEFIRYTIINAQSTLENARYEWTHNDDVFNSLEETLREKTKFDFIKQEILPHLDVCMDIYLMRRFAEYINKPNNQYGYLLNDIIETGTINKQDFNTWRLLMQADLDNELLNSSEKEQEYYKYNSDSKYRYKYLLPDDFLKGSEKVTRKNRHYPKVEEFTIRFDPDGIDGMNVRDLKKLFKRIIGLKGPFAYIDQDEYRPSVRIRLKFDEGIEKIHLPIEEILGELTDKALKPDCELELILPETATEIYGFQGLIYMKKLDMSRTCIKKVGAGAFGRAVFEHQNGENIKSQSYNCGLEEVILSPLTETISEGAFEGCPLKRVVCNSKQKKLFKDTFAKDTFLDAKPEDKSMDEAYLRQIKEIVSELAQDDKKGDK